MLTLMLMTQDDGRGLDLVLRQIAAARCIASGPDDAGGALLSASAQSAAPLPVVIIDTGSSDGTLQRLRDFVAGPGQGAILICLQQPQLSLAAARELARAETGSPYVLGLTGQDRLLVDHLPGLLDVLERDRPDLVIDPQGIWQTAELASLPMPDSLRLQGADPVNPAELMPDLNRLMPTADLVATQGTVAADAGLLGDWHSYDRWLQQAGKVVVAPAPLVLRPQPAPGVSQLLTWLQAALVSLRGGRRRALLLRGLTVLGDEMAFCDPAQASEDAAAAWAFYRALGWRERRLAAAQPGAGGQLMAALRRGGQLMAALVLGQVAAAQDRRRLAALTQEIRRLREDLDLALPGPDYLRILYERVRPR